MKKNNIVKILCVICIIAVLISVFGCKKEVANPDGGVVDFNQMSVVDGTVVFTNEYTDAQGNTKTATMNVDVDTVNKPIFQSSGLTGRKNFATEIGPKLYQMPSDVAQSVTEEPENWKEFSFTKYIENKSDKVLACKSVKVEKNGETGIWINTNLDAEFTTGAHSALDITVWGIADMSNFSNNDQVDTAYEQMKIYLEYTLVDNALGDIDWDNAEIKTMELF